MFDLTAPHLSGDVGNIGRGLGSEATANVLRIVESDMAKTVVWGTLAIVGAYVAYSIAVGLHREFGGAKPPVEHSVLHRNERTLPNVSGFIYDEGGPRGRLCLAGEQASWEPDTGKRAGATLVSAADFEKLMKLDEWNDVVIRAEGNRIRHYLNGRLTLDFTDNDPAKALSKGVLALQLHAGKPMWAEYRDIRLKQF